MNGKLVDTETRTIKTLIQYNMKQRSLNIHIIMWILESSEAIKNNCLLIRTKNQWNSQRKQ